MSLNIFVSFNYVGKYKNIHTIYSGFHSFFISFRHIPECQEDLEELISLVEEKAKEKLGFETISCDVMFFN